MAKPPRDVSRSASRTYFVTAKTWANRALFRNENLARMFLGTLYQYRAQGKFQLHEFVLMPDHFHVLLTTAPEITIERAVQFIKGGFSHRAGKEHARALEIWQRGYVEHRVRDAVDYARHREYIRQNPVERRLAASPEEYPHSSASGAYELDPPPQGLKPLK